MLYDAGVPLSAKAFQLGLRIEHPQEEVNLQKYGRPEYVNLLGAADYSLVARARRDVFTFCMCAGGTVIPSVSEPSMFCTNGMSNSRHDTPFANSGIVATLSPDEFGSPHPLAGMEVQRRFESAAFRLAGGDYSCPIQRANDFVAGRADGSEESGWRLPIGAAYDCAGWMRSSPPSLPRRFAEDCPSWTGNGRDASWSRRSWSAPKCGEVRPFDWNVNRTAGRARGLRACFPLEKEPALPAESFPRRSTACSAPRRWSSQLRTACEQDALTLFLVLRGLCRGEAMDLAFRASGQARRRRNGRRLPGPLRRR